MCVCGSVGGVRRRVMQGGVVGVIEFALGQGDAKLLRAVGGYEVWLMISGSFGFRVIR